MNQNSDVDALMQFSESRSLPIPDREGARKSTSGGKPFADGIADDVQGVVLIDCRDFYLAVPKGGSAGRIACLRLA